MCGIVGVIAKGKSGLFTTQIEAFSQLLFLDQVRGTDGTGIIYNKKEGKVHSLKGPETASIFLERRGYEKAMKDCLLESSFIIGHNRAATKGKLVWKDTHPFNEQHITLVHNGTLLSQKELNDKVSVDSHAICMHLAEKGYKETLETIDGAFALVWADSKENTLNLVRNSQRPLNLIEYTTCWLISSELGLGKWVGERNNLVHIKDIPINTGTLYSFDLEDTSEFTETAVEYKKPLPYFNKYASFYQGEPGYYPSTVHTPIYTPTPALLTRNKAHAWGERVVFSPNRIKLSLSGGETAIIYDARLAPFLSGKIIDEPRTVIKVYGDLKHLKELEDWDSLEGTVTSTQIQGGRYTYVLTNVKPAPDVECAWCPVKLAHRDLPSLEKDEWGYLCPLCASDAAQYGKQASVINC